MSPDPILPRPQPGDAPPHHFAYIDEVPADEDVMASLTAQPEQLRHLLADLPPDRETWRYAPGKWTIRELVGHLVDTERVFGYRAFHMARGDEQPLPSMDEDAFAAVSGADHRPLADLLVELATVRQGNLLLFRSLDADAWERVGTASDNPFRVRAFPYIICGHLLHHRRILRERYL